MTATTCVSQRLPLSHEEAAAATDQWRLSLSSCRARRRRARASRFLALDRRFVPSGGDACVLRRLAGRSRLWGTSARVELEIRKWSHDTCEVTLRPLTLRWPVLTRRYGHEASHVIETLVAQLLMIAATNAGASHVAPAGPAAVDEPDHRLALAS
jgi:hypothetical protein